MIVDFSHLAAIWRRWAPAIGGGNVAVSTECKDCTVLFSSDDAAFHLRNDESWWVLDTVNDRGQRRQAVARLSNSALAEKFLIWDWATTARSSLASGALGVDLARLGFAPGVEVSKMEGKYQISMGSDCAILSIVDATIFSHLMSKSIDEIEQLADRDD